MQLYIIGGIAGGIAIVIMALSLVQYSNEEYALDVDAFKDQSDLMGFVRVILTNTGRSPLTNIIIDFGDYKEVIPNLPSGEKMIISPRVDTQVDHVVVTADNGITIKKQFRTAPKMPGMIGGMG